MQWSERLLEQGEKRSVRKGELLGVQKGLRGFLADLLAERVGALDEAVLA